MKLKKNEKYVNALAYAKGSFVNVREQAKTSSKIMEAPKRYDNGKVTSFGVFTGFYFKKDDGTWYHVHTNKGKRGYCRHDVITVKFNNNNEDLKAQKIINELTDNNLNIRKSLIRTLPLVKNLSASNKLPADKYNTYKNLVNRLVKRENELKSSNLVKIQTGTIKQYNDLMAKWGLESLSIGAAPVIAWVIGAVVAAGVGAGVTAYFLSYHGESKVDLQVSTDLEKALASLDKPTADRVKADLQGQLDNSFNKGYSESKATGFLGDIKKIAIFLLGAVAMDKILNR